VAARGFENEHQKNNHSNLMRGEMRIANLHLVASAKRNFVMNITPHLVQSA